MPKPYVRKMPATWWLQRRSYFYFMMRELTALFIAAFCVELLVFVYRIKQGPMSYMDFLDQLKHPAAIGFHFIAFLFAAYHSITWFNLTPKAIVVRTGEDKVPDAMLILPNYVAWVVLSAGLVWVVFR